jgi:golgi-specific brefeldin A-resistance guanine nucleotide exchange factor 1
MAEILRRFAETTMHALVRIVFTRLHELDPIKEEEKLKVSEEDPQEGEIRMTVSANSGAPSSEDPADPPLNGEVSSDQAVNSIPSVQHEEPPPTPGNRPACELVIDWITNRLIYWSFLSDGLPSIIELLRVLINVLDPNDQQHTDSTRTIALGILNAAFEESGSRIAEYPSLEGLVLDPGCKFLFQLARSDNPSVLHLALRTITTVFETMRQHLKLQQELFLAFTIDRLAPPIPHPGARFLSASNKKAGSNAPSRPSTPANTPPLLGINEADPDGEREGVTLPRAIVPPAKGLTRDLILETLSQLSRHPSFMVDLYTNYDCDINCENMFERLIDFLTKVCLAVWRPLVISNMIIGSLPSSVHGRLGGPTPKFTVSLFRPAACLCERYGPPSRRSMYNLLCLWLRS